MPSTAADGNDWVEQSGRGDGDGNNVIAERPDEVLANCGEGGAAQGDGLRDLRDIAVKQGNVSGLDRAMIGAGTHGDANVGLSKRGGIVDAIADHGNAEALGLECATRSSLSSGRTPAKLGDTDTLCSLRRALIVPGHHDHAETEPVERGNGACCVLLYVIEDVEDAAHLAVDGDEDGRAACGFQALNRRPGGVGDGPAVLDQPVVPGEHSLTVHGAATPRAVSDSNQVAGGSESERSWAASTTARLSGCSLPLSAAAASASTSSSLSEPVATMSVTWGRPR